ncbi:NAD(P)-dependent oxidoreductase [Paractinoplanes lichenicola]|uniref:NAD(P)H-binding protein n=1 Tax=Paractinoplanes lichenicola TaxID=2802976 RepID=A0ABS1VFL3_9ACTN|nr:NAD(P)H-binding protein [Actinoplanes lichenicola]MBL7252959.1 NAD(P)H-binding protein [Actinoplanes lichenicola]
MRQDVSQILKVAVVGASGTTGRHVVTSALERGHTVTACVRRPATFAGRERLTEAIWPDVHATSALTEALTGADAVISTLGGAGKGPTTVCTDGIRTTLTAMKAAGVTRLIAVSAHGVLETHDRSLYSLAVWAGVADRMRDKETMEPLIASSDLDWTIVRPPKLSDRPATATNRVGTDLPIHVWSSVGRADLAAFLIDEAEHPRYVRAYPRIAR